MTDSSTSAHEVATQIIRRVADDLAWLANRTLHVDRIETSDRAQARPTGNFVSIGFRFAVEHSGRKHEGVLCMPLSEAITFSAGLLGYDPKATLEAGSLDAPTQELKAGMIELAKFVAKAAKVQLSRSLMIQTRGEGRSCIGLRPASTPPLSEASSYLTTAAEWSFHGRDSFEISMALDSRAFEAEEEVGASERQAA